MKRLSVILFCIAAIACSSVANAQTSLLHYWSFNSITARVNIPAPAIKADFSYLDTNKAIVQYAVIPGTPQAYIDSINTATGSNGAYDNVGGDTVNVRLGYPKSNALRVRNPTWSSELRIYMPTTSYSSIAVKYALQSSGSGQKVEDIAYSTDSGATWKNRSSGLTVNGSNVDTLDCTQSKYQQSGTTFGLVAIGFGADATVNNNPKLVLRIRFHNQSSTFTGNNRFDNLSVEGSPMPAITVVMPQVGDLLSSTDVDTITFQTQGAISSSRLVDYSIDSGITWNSIGTVLNQGTSIPWTIPILQPNPTSTKCFVRVRDTSGVTGISGMFSIVNKSITVQVPHLGDTVAAGDTVLVSFQTHGSVTQTRTLDYSVDSGKTWNRVGSTTGGTSIPWVVPYLQSGPSATKNFVRVTDNSGVVGVSGQFTLFNQTIAVQTPRSGDSLVSGDSVALTIATIGHISASRFVDFSSDSGRTWKRSLTIGQGGKSARWVVPILVPPSSSANCFVRVSDTTGVTGVSGRFSIYNKTITLLTPHGGELYVSGDSIAITFVTRGTSISRFRVVDYSIDSGKFWDRIGLLELGTSIPWKIPALFPNVNSTKCFVRVVDQNGVTGTTGVFSIYKVKPLPPPPANGTPIVVHYWGFKSLTAGVAYHNPGIPALKADYSLLDTNAALVSYILEPGTSSTYAGYIDNVVGDTTNAQLGISGNALRVRNPSDSMELRINMPTTGFKNISVAYGLQSSSVASGQLTELFDYSVDGGTTWKTSGLNVNGTSADTLDVTQAKYVQTVAFGLAALTFGTDTTVNNNAKLVLRIKFNGNTSKTSGNNRFENIAVWGTAISGGVVPPPQPASIAVTSPRPGDTLWIGKTVAINFSVSGPVTSSRTIEFSTDSGATWSTVTTVSGASSYSWTVPNSPTMRGLVRVRDANGVLASSGKFEVLLPGSISGVVVTGGSDGVVGGSPVTITWLASGYLGNTLDIDVSYDGLQTWSTITHGWAYSSATSYVWIAPDTAQSDASIRLTFTAGVMGYSYPFSITLPAQADVAVATSHSDATVWPNPVSSHAFIRCGEMSVASSQLSLHDITGRDVTALVLQVPSADGFEIDATRLVPGVYFYSLSGLPKVSTGQFVVAR